MKFLSVGMIVLVLFIGVVAICNIAIYSKIDLVKETESTHVFGYYPTLKSRRDTPVKTLVVPIIDGNYLGNPSKIDFNVYLAKCIMDTSHFTWDGYLKHFNCIE